jgi:argininosuccinate lyase
MAKKLWGGRFKKKLDKKAEEYSYSLNIDKRLFYKDLETNFAHAKALTKVNILSEKELNKLELFFNKIREQFQKDETTILGHDEDIHSCVERIITEELGDLGKKIHTGKSRNDQVITDVRLYLKDEIKDILGALKQLQKSLLLISKKHKDLIFPGFTHLQPAQPILLAHHFLAYFEMFSRDYKRFSDTFEQTDVCPLGSGALAGNNYELDRNLVAKELGFSRITNNSMDAVADRDFILEFCSNASICMMHLSRICEEFIIWSSPLVGFIQIGDDFTTGSSIMPQKKNPDIAELIRGKSGRILGNITALHHLMKGLPLTYNRDMQEDKVMLFDTVDTLKLSLINFSKMLGTISFNEESIELALKKGFLLATDFADYLVIKGVPFREAHEITGNVVRYAEENQKQLEDLSYEELNQFSKAIEKDVKKVFNFREAINRKNVYGGTATKQVEVQLTRAENNILGEK